MMFSIPVVNSNQQQQQQQQRGRRRRRRQQQYNNNFHHHHDATRQQNKCNQIQQQLLRLLLRIEIALLIGIVSTSCHSYDCYIYRQHHFAGVITLSQQYCQDLVVACQNESVVLSSSDSDGCFFYQQRDYRCNNDSNHDWLLSSQIITNIPRGGSTPNTGRSTTLPNVDELHRRPHSNNNNNNRYDPNHNDHRFHNSYNNDTASYHPAAANCAVSLSSSSFLSFSSMTPPQPPPPPEYLPLRFLRAGKNQPMMGLQRYEATLQWRKEQNIDTLLLQYHQEMAFQYFNYIKQHYKHYYHYTGYYGQPCFYECPGKSNINALLHSSSSNNNHNKNHPQQQLTLSTLIRHYLMITEFQWQYLQVHDLQQSIYVIDCDQMNMRQVLFSETISFMKQVLSLSSQHYPERAGIVYIINVPSWFHILWNMIKPFIDVDTLQKIHILRNNRKEIQDQLQLHIPIEHIPPEYGGTSLPLGQSPQEKVLQEFIHHHRELQRQRQHPKQQRHDQSYSNQYPSNHDCQFCHWKPVRSY